MVNSLIIGVTSLLAVNSSEIKENLNKSNKDVVRVTCTINVPDGFGGSIGISGTSGNIFTSAATARENACKKAAQNAMAIMMDM